MDRLYESFSKLLKATSTDFLRYKYMEINWNSHMLGLVGPRGVGKTTMFLQYIKQNLKLNDTLYVSADNMFFADNSLIDLTDRFSKQGGKHLFIDEITSTPIGHANSNIGNVRETFFYNQMRVEQEVISSRISGFLIGERTFEIGGKNKGQQQISNAREGYVVKDDIETGYGNVVPLWNFGMNY